MPSFRTTPLRDLGDDPMRPTGRTRTMRTGTRTTAGVTPEAERAARTSAYADIDPRTFGMVSDADMAAFRSAYERSVFGQAGADVDAMLAERGMGARGGEAIRALMRSQAALPLAEIDYRRRATGAAAFSTLAAERARQAYLALTAGRTQTYEETGEDTKEVPSGPVGAIYGGGGGGGGGGIFLPSKEEDWWERTAREAREARAAKPRDESPVPWPSGGYGDFAPGPTSTYEPTFPEPPFGGGPPPGGYGGISPIPDRDEPPGGGDLYGWTPGTSMDVITAAAKRGIFGDIRRSYGGT